MASVELKTFAEYVDVASRQNSFKVTPGLTILCVPLFFKQKLPEKANLISCMVWKKYTVV